MNHLRIVYFWNFTGNFPLMIINVMLGETGGNCIIPENNYGLFSWRLYIPISGGIIFFTIAE